MTCSFLRLLTLLSLSCAILSGAAFAETGEKAQAVRAFLDNGNPQQAISTANALLRNSTLDPSERMQLLSLIAQSEEVRARYGHYQDVRPAIDALDALLKEFPDHPDAADFRWQRASLFWHSGQSKLAIDALRDLLSQDQQTLQQRRAWLLLARIHLQLNHLPLARSDLLQYGLNVDDDSADQAIGLSWMAIIDWRESRPDIAFKMLSTVFKTRPETITSEPEFYAAYIQLLNQHGQRQDALHHASRFLISYLTTPEAAAVRLLRTDIMAEDPSELTESIKEYGILSHDQAESVIGLQAFMRKLMLENRLVTKKEKLLPKMASLKKIADQNQMSVIEDEATLDLARLWQRIDMESDSPSHPALLAYAHATSSTDPDISSISRMEGSNLLRKLMQARLDKQQWLPAVRLWRAYPQLRPDTDTDRELRFGVAHAMRMVMLLEQADEMLAALYDEEQDNIRGQRIMTERIKLWGDRNDADAVEKSLSWLNTHEFTIYRPEILSTIARIQIQQQHAEEARQTLTGVRASDLAVESRAAYWQTKAEISEALMQWHSAGQAWLNYRNSEGSNKIRGLRRQAENMFAGAAFAEAKALYLALPDSEHDTAWQYHVAMCQLKTGQSLEATEGLTSLAANKEADTYVALAKLALADQLAGRLLKSNP